jgi:hypothetical protein
VATFLGAANLLLGHHERQGVRVGRAVFEVDERLQPNRPWGEATVVLRPEDVVVGSCGARLLAARGIGRGKVVELEFAGAAERIRLSVEAGETLASALRPGDTEFLMEALRDEREAERMPLAVGADVTVGAKRVHVLPTPVSSLRLLAHSAADGERLAATPLVGGLADCLHISPTQHFDAAQAQRALLGLPVVELAPGNALAAAMKVLERGAAQVLAVAPGAPRIERLLIHVQASRAARDGALSAAGSLLRHLGVDGSLLVGAEDRSRHAPSYRQLLDLRSSALRLHGVDLRTETFHGGLAEEVRARLVRAPACLLLIGLTSLDAGAALVEELGAVLDASPPAAVLLVCGRSETALQAPEPHARAAASGLR